MNSTQFKPVRLQAALTIRSVLQQQASLASLMAPAQQKVSSSEQSLLQELCFGTLRWQPQLQAILNRLLEKPLKSKDTDIHSLLLLGLYQLKFMRIPDHAVINSTVASCKLLKKSWAEKLVNGILRRYQRERAELENALANSPSYVTAHPNWLRKGIEQFWPDLASNIFSANNAHPPFTLRLDLSRVSRPEYLERLKDRGYSAVATSFSPYGVTLQQAIDVHQLPGFDEGELSVQDEAAQLAAALLKLQPGDRVLDCCCAPGGKTGHLLELAKQLASPIKELVALELEPRRMERVEQNLQRLGYRPHTNNEQIPITLVCADALNVGQWWDGVLFDRILLDAPCSATGVIRRHPDIKVLRNAADIAKLAQLQRALLEALWPTLQSGGTLLYATCSVLPTENSNVIAGFLADHCDAEHQIVDVSCGIAQTYGRQLLPQQQGHDGFYYASLKKITNA